MCLVFVFAEGFMSPRTSSAYACLSSNPPQCDCQLRQTRALHGRAVKRLAIDSPRAWRRGVEGRISSFLSQSEQQMIRGLLVFFLEPA